MRDSDKNFVIELKIGPILILVNEAFAHLTKSIEPIKNIKLFLENEIVPFHY